MTGSPSIAPHPAREHLALALDVDSADDALALVRRLRPWFGVAKVGLELFSAAGPEIIAAVRTEGFAVFADLKLHDIPTTVRKAARVMGASGATYVTTHTAGGEAMVRAAVEGFEAGASAAGFPRPITLGVTVLTSDADATTAVFDARVAVAVAASCPGLVCSAPDVGRALQRYPGAIAVCPGVRPAGAGTDDQARVATPGAAIEAGAALVVIGRPVTAAADPEAMATAVADEVSLALRQRRGMARGMPEGV